MNILDNISAKSLLLRTFLQPEAGHKLSEYTPVPLHRIFGTDPEFVQYSAFENGYEMSVTVTSCEDLRYIADYNYLSELVVVTGDDKCYQIGSEEGFELVGIIPPPSPDKTLFVYTFKTNKPNNQPYQIRTYD